MRIHPFFPEARLQDPKRQVELTVYRHLEACDAPGVAIYAARLDRSCTECDFAIWLTDVARFGVQVKGGHYTVERGVWYLGTPAGPERMPSPMKQCWDPAMGLNRFLQGRIKSYRNPFIVPVLVFPDMDENEEIEAWASQSRIHVLWGSDRLREGLIEMVDGCNVFYPPTAEETIEEVELVTPGLGGPARRRIRLFLPDFPEIAGLVLRPPVGLFEVHRKGHHQRFGRGGSSSAMGRALVIVLTCSISSW